MTAFRSLSGDKKTHTTPRRSKGVGGSSLSRSAPASEQSAWKVLNYPSPRSRCVNYEFFQILITSIILRTGITHTHTHGQMVPTANQSEAAEQKVGAGAYGACVRTLTHATTLFSHAYENKPLITPGPAGDAMIQFKCKCNRAKSPKSKKERKPRVRWVGRANERARLT